MEDKKQELLKLIDNLDWDKFVDLGCSGLSVYSYTVALLCDNQKEKTIEQKLEELGFRRLKNIPYDKNKLNELWYALWYVIWEGDDQISLGYDYSLSNTSYQVLIYKDKTKKILDFANHLVNIKNGDEQ